MSRFIRSLIAVSLIAAVISLSSNPVAAQSCDGQTQLGGNTAQASGYCTGGTPGRTPSYASSSNPANRWNHFCPTDAIGEYQPNYTVQLVLDWTIGGEDAFEGDYEFIVSQGWDPSGTYARYTVLCIDENGNILSQWDPYYVATVDPVPPEDIRDDALAKIVFPNPDLTGMEALFHAAQLESWSWVDNDWEVISESETVGLVTVEVAATPERVLWNPGDGNSLECLDAGVEWSPAVNDGGTTCGHTYTSGTADEPGLVYQAEATIEWDLTWSINGVDQGSFGTGDATTLFEVPVGEVQIVEVS